MSNQGFSESLGSVKLNPSSEELTNVLKSLFYWIKPANSQNNSQNNSKLELLHTIKDFPENSHIENYMLFNDIVTDEDIDSIINAILSIIKPNKQKEIESLFSKISKRRFLSLLVLISRNSKDGFILSNNMKTLYTELFTYFKGIKEEKSSISGNIKDLFIEFVKRYNSTITSDLIISILSGKEIYKIYQIGYSRKNKPPLFSSHSKQTHSVNLLSSDLIKKRTNDWVSSSINSPPIAYILDDYSKEEKNVLIKNNKFCKEISQLTDDIKEFYSSSFEISKSIFSNDIFTDAVKDTSNTIQKNRDHMNTLRNRRSKSKSRRGGSTRRKYSNPVIP